MTIYNEEETMTTLAELAGEAYGCFTRVQRGEESIVTLKDDAPEWVRDLAYEAHGDFLPDDWRYESIRSALAAIHDNEVDDPDDADDAGSEWADSNVDSYNGSRAAWLASNLNRASYCDDAAEEGLVSEDASIMQRIGLGQYVESQEIWGLVISSLQAELESREG